MEGDAFSAICCDLDIASCRDSSEEGFSQLKSVVPEGFAVAAETGAIGGSPVSRADLLEFISGHRGSPAFPIRGFNLAA
jgi:hypothetical protein